MAGYNVTVVHENRYKIVNSASVPSEGTIKDNIFVRDNKKKAEIIGVLKEGFKRSFLRDGNGNDYIYKEGTTANIVLPILDAIEKRCIYDLKEQDYIVLSKWK